MAFRHISACGFRIAENTLFRLDSDFGTRICLFYNNLPIAGRAGYGFIFKRFIAIKLLIAERAVE